MTETTTPWSIESYSLHNEAMRKVEDRFQNERDRRYTEVNIEKEKALKIKETADLAALSLARESQTYKEQQNDALRDKNLSESGVYATNVSVSQAISGVNVNINNLEAKLDASLQPLINFVAGQKGATNSSQITKTTVFAIIGAVAAIVATIFYILGGFTR